MRNPLKIGLIALAFFAQASLLFSQSTEDLLHRLSDLQLGPPKSAGEALVRMSPADQRDFLDLIIEDQFQHSAAYAKEKAAADKAKYGAFISNWNQIQIKAAGNKPELDALALKANMDAAAKGDAYGEFRMGERYRDGDGVEKDLKKAREWFSKAADQGDKEAAKRLSAIPDIDVLKARAIADQKTAAESGDCVAQYQLGMRYLHGDGVQSNRELAIFWFQAGATNKNYVLIAAGDRLRELTNTPPSK